MTILSVFYLFLVRFNVVCESFSLIIKSTHDRLRRLIAKGENWNNSIELILEEKEVFIEKEFFDTWKWIPIINQSTVLFEKFNRMCVPCKTHWKNIKVSNHHRDAPKPKILFKRHLHQNITKGKSCEKICGRTQTSQMQKLWWEKHTYSEIIKNQANVNALKRTQELEIFSRAATAAAVWYSENRVYQNLVTKSNNMSFFVFVCSRSRIKRTRRMPESLGCAFRLKCNISLLPLFRWAATNNRKQWNV